MRRLAAATIAAAAVLAAAASPARAGWSPPQTISAAHSFARPHLAIRPTGSPLAAWSWQDGLGNAARTGAEMAPLRFAPAANVRTLPHQTVAGPVASGGARLIVATQTDRSDRSALFVRFGNLAGEFVRPRLVARGRWIRGAQLAANAAGDAVLGWWVDDGAFNDRVYVSLRRRGGTFGAPILLARGRVRSTSVTIGARGDVLAAWDARGIVRTRFKPRGRAFEAVDELRSKDAYFAALQTAVDARGAAWVAWNAQFRSEGGDAGRVYVQLARRAAGGHRFGVAHLLDDVPSTARSSPVSLALDAGGGAIAAWVLFGRTAGAQVNEVRVAQVAATGAPGVATVASFVAIEPLDSASVASNPSSGDAAVVWTQSTAEPAQLYASVRTTGAWGAPELVAGGPALTAPLAAYSAGALIAVYANRVSTRPLETLIQASKRL